MHIDIQPRGITRGAVLLAALLTLLALGAAFAPQPAQADNCEPTELVFGSEEPGEEEDKPHCVVAQQFVYPTLGCSPNLMDCVGHITNGDRELLYCTSGGSPESQHCSLYGTDLRPILPGK